MTRWDDLKLKLIERDGSTCSICGKTLLMDLRLLRIEHIKPVSRGGKSDLDNLRIVCPECNFYVTDLREYEFVDYLVCLLRMNSTFSEVQQEISLGYGQAAYAKRIDIFAQEIKNNNWSEVYIECKSQRGFSLRRIEDMLTQLKTYHTLIEGKRLALAFPGTLPKKTIEAIEAQGIEVWDIPFLSQRFENEIPYVEHPVFQPILLAALAKKQQSPEEILIQKLRNCQPGKEDWSKYQKIIGEILERLFCPPLSTPISERSDAEQVNRRDYILTNYAESGFWHFLRTTYQADYIVVDAKNYKNDVGKKEALQIANYLKPHGAGLFGIIFCRDSIDNGCECTLREQWTIHRKLIIVVSDRDVEQMLLNKSSNGPPEEIIKQKIEDFRLSM
ncbi:HNH endonuclease [Floridanema evergladense]|uniref:HNH endonuclease n=1 Tax=Floridaenema evergladense BLCC-F167 TaxID=3153639 RepID=A0ABV4WLV2_9CYAN